MDDIWKMNKRIKFHTEALNELLEPENKFGFIVVDQKETLFGTLSGNTLEVDHRFAPLLMEKRHSYIRKTRELATEHFIDPSTSLPNVTGLILAGSADFETELSQKDEFDSRLAQKILRVVRVSYGGEMGLNQAIELSSDILANVKLIQEKHLIGKFFEEISEDTGKYVFGVDDTLKALNSGAVETLIVWEDLDVSRYVMRDSSTGETVIKHLNKGQEGNAENFKVGNSKLDVVAKMSLLDCLPNQYIGPGCALELVSNKSMQGRQFCKAFGGIGGILCKQLDLYSFDSSNDREVYDDEEWKKLICIA